MATLTLQGIEGVRQHAGQSLGVSEWHEVTQAEVDRFAAATGDDNWIHVDPRRAGETAFGGTIAQGFYTLSLAPRFNYALYEIVDISFGVNYGTNKVRFPAPLKVGSRVRMHAELTAVDDVPGGVQMTQAMTFEGEGTEKPVCVADMLIRVFA